MKRYANNRSLKRRIEFEGISIDHFTHTSSTISPKKKNVYEYLYKDAPTGSDALKKRLIVAGLLIEVCYICGHKPSWNDKKLVLQLDHINGDHSDNRLINLRLLDPNCHTQTDTLCQMRMNRSKKCIICQQDFIPDGREEECYYCTDPIVQSKREIMIELNSHSDFSKNILNHEYPKPKKIVKPPPLNTCKCGTSIAVKSARCPSCAQIHKIMPQIKPKKKTIIKKKCKCGKTISQKSKNCNSCASRLKTHNRKIQNRPTYQEIMQMKADGMSMVKIGKKYGVSDNAVRKWLKWDKPEVEPKIIFKKEQPKLCCCGKQIDKRSPYCRSCTQKARWGTLPKNLTTKPTNTPSKPSTVSTVQMADLPTDPRKLITCKCGESFPTPKDQLPDETSIAEHVLICETVLEKKKQKKAKLKLDMEEEMAKFQAQIPPCACFATYEETRNTFNKYFTDVNAIDATDLDNVPSTPLTIYVDFPNLQPKTKRAGKIFWQTICKLALNANTTFEFYMKPFHKKFFLKSLAINQPQCLDQIQVYVVNSKGEPMARDDILMLKRMLNLTEGETGLLIREGGETYRDLGFHPHVDGTPDCPTTKHRYGKQTPINYTLYNCEYEMQDDGIVPTMTPVKKDSFQVEETIISLVDFHPVDYFIDVPYRG